jgi:ketosteroid isomerase-like protein
MPSTDAALRDMLDEHQLGKLVHAYCRAVDRGDFAMLRSLYAPDASDAHAASLDEYVAQLEATRPYLRSMQHHVTTVNFAVDGDRAEGEVYAIATHTLRAKGRDVDVTIGGRYLDRYEKHSGAWRFSRRSLVTDWAEVNDPSRVDFSHPITRDSPVGTLDDSDPSHAFFQLL